MSTSSVSPELKELLRKWVIIQKEKYGDDWKNKLAKEMAEATIKQDFITQFKNSFKK